MMRSSVENTNEIVLVVGVSLHSRKLKYFVSINVTSLNVDGMENDKLRELVRTLIRRHGSVETPLLGTSRRLAITVQQDTTVDNDTTDGSGSDLRPGTSTGG